MISLGNTITRKKEITGQCSALIEQAGLQANHVNGMPCATLKHKGKYYAKYVIGVLTHQGLHIYTLLETRSQPPAGNINTLLQQCGCAAQL
eukprot:7939149-Ditylum_brightwellii.AAC.1